MKPMALNLSKMKKVGGDNKSSTFQHPDGHKIVVAHEKLPALQKKQLERMPVQMLAEGDAKVSPVPDDQMQPGWTQNPAAFGRLPSDDLPQQVPDPNYVNPAGATVDLSGVMQQQNPAQPQPDQSNNQSPSQGAPQVQSAGPTGGASPDAASSAIGLGQKAIREQQDVESKQSAANSGIEQSDIDARKQLMDGMTKNTQDFRDNNQKFMNDYANNHIDPKHYMESMGSGQKVATAIGLFLGGLSTPFTHQGNPAQEFLNQQINRDIESQQSRLGQQKTLLEANQNLYHDNILANNATRMNLNDVYSHQIQQAADKLGTPQAKAKADMAVAQFQLQNNQLLQQNALRATVLHSMKDGGGQGLDAIDLSHAGLMTPEQAEKEQSSVNAQKTAHNAIDKYYDDMEKEQKTGNLLNPESMRRVDTANAGLTTSVMEASPSKRLTKESIDQEVKPYRVQTTDDPSVRAYKRQEAHALIEKHADPTPVMSKYAPKSLPKYGSGPQLGMMGGVQYQKVAGGWQKVK